MLYYSTCITLPKDSEVQGEEERGKEGALDEMANEVLQSLPGCSLQNAEYVMRKLAKSHGGLTSKGQFVCKGETVKHLHMID